MSVRSEAGIHEARIEQTLIEATELPGTVAAIKKSREYSAARAKARNGLQSAGQILAQNRR
jgi:hypothetical protein